MGVLCIFGALEDAEDRVQGPQWWELLLLLPSSPHHRTTPRWGSDRQDLIGFRRLGEYVIVKGPFLVYQSLPGITPKLWDKIDMVS